MNERRNWTAIPGLFILAIGAVVLSAYSGASSSQNNQPRQPIDFPHPLHAAGQMNMNCLYCHNTANKSPDPGMPAVSTCMGCHLVVPGRTVGGKADIQKLMQYYAGGHGKPIPWVRIHKVPEYVRFPHMRHVNAGVTCQACHGQVQEMLPVHQQESLNMGWCIDCHLERQVRYDCSVCHY